MIDHRIDFGALAWERLAPGARQKAVRRGDMVLRLVEFTSEFVEPEWCSRGHAGMVLEGELDVDFDGAVVHLAAGDGIFILPGPNYRHKASVSSGMARLVLYEHA